MEKDKIVFKGSHPDSLYRVPVGGGIGASKFMRVLRILRWPAALFAVCIALAIFVYFLIPENLSPEFDTVNATNWVDNNANAPSPRNPDKLGRKPSEHVEQTTKGNSRTHGTKPQEIDFYDGETAKTIDLKPLIETSTEKGEKIKIHVPPVFPSHITPEVQYGNEKADTDKLRIPKLLEKSSSEADETTLKPHITQSPEKPLAIYFGEGKLVTPPSETISRAETNNDIIHYDEREQTKGPEETSSKTYSTVYKDTSTYVRNGYTNFNQQSTAPELPQEIHSYYQLTPAVSNKNRFTSGHSKLFGISMEDAERMKPTTQSSLYNTRVSPTLPTWRDRVDSTTKNYPINVNLDVSQCRSTGLALCRGVLPYDLAGPAVTLDGVEITELLPQIEYLIATNCSSRVAQFFCALLEPECSPAPYLPKMPCYNFCRAVADSCEGSIPRELASVFGCTRYPTSGCSAARSPCDAAEFECGDASCVPRHWSCDGAADCPAAEDEAQCSNNCARNEFRCSTGGCISMRWLCDGYSDCPGGEDEGEQVCESRPRDGDEELGEQSAGSAPALAVRRPNRVPDDYADVPIHRTGEVESSKELLMTSDSNSGLKRNFTRRPSRIQPYNRPILHDSKSLTEDRVNLQANAKVSERRGGQNNYNNSKNISEGRAASKTDAKDISRGLGPVAPTRLDKSINNLERVIDGAAMIKKAAAQDDVDSSEGKLDMMEHHQEKQSQSNRRSHPAGSASAHASPCPSGELRCVDGRCITLAQLCDGTIDCSDHADEDNCYT